MKFSVIRWIVTLVGVQMLAGVVWVLGPLWPELEPQTIRLAAVGDVLQYVDGLQAFAAGGVHFRSRNQVSTLQHGMQILVGGSV